MDVNKPEKEGAQRLIKLMRSDGWTCHRLNVSAGIYSTTGFPDYYCTHKSPFALATRKRLFDKEEYWLQQPYRWIEFKVENGGLSISQVNRFKEFDKHNIGVWVLRDERDYLKLFEPPNWWQWCMRGKLR